MDNDIKAFAQAILIRAIRTFCQAFVAAIPTTAATLGSVQWVTVISTAALAAVISVATSIATGLPEVGHGDAPTDPIEDFLDETDPEAK